MTGVSSKETGNFEDALLEDDNSHGLVLYKGDNIVSLIT